MAEQESQHAPFDETALAEVLGTRSASVRDVAYGEGRQYFLGRGDARLEIFPRTGVTRLTTVDARVELFGGATAQVSGSGLEFSRTSPGQDASLTVVPGGGIVFTLVVGGERRPVLATEPEEPPTAPPPPTSSPVRAPETAQEPRSAADHTSVPPRPVRASTTPSAAREPTSPPSSREAASSQSPAAAQTEQERIALTGRLGRDPSFRTTKTGSLVARFPLAVHREDGHTDWHTVLAFGSRAEQLQRRVGSGELVQGREVDVVGYRHVNTRPGKDGTPRQVQEVYAVAVKKR
jgi:hypothetical protein